MHASRFLHIFIIFLIISHPYSVFCGLNPEAKFFAEIYNETTNIKRQEGNWISMFHSLQGIRVRTGTNFIGDVYVKQRIGGDANRDYWNNRAEFMLGFRLSYSRIIYLGAFAEFAEGKYFGVDNSENPLEKNLRYDDSRFGLILWHGWTGRMLTKNNYFPLNLWDEVYGDAIYYRMHDRNVIYYLNGKFGLRILKFGSAVFDIYLTNYLLSDKLGDFWNNRSDQGMGFRIKPWADKELSLFVEILDGSYVDRDSRYENPHSKEYTDVRVGLILWYGWGF